MNSGKFSEQARAPQKKAYRFNIIDFVLIAIIIAAVSLLVYIMLGNDIFGGGETSNILYTIEINPIKNDFLSSAHLITKGTKIIESIRTNDLGEIQDIKITDAISLTTDLETGIVKETLYPDFSKVVITVLAKCKKDKIKFVVNGETIMVGIQINFRTPYLVSYGTCTSLVETDEEGNPIDE
ncbi:MAG: DUF4330 domain-containing protein [Oscillospiraceae bacterium]|nr:DUF4330 domain-containing protein [Oscillospiraceae bacterium]